MAAALLLAGALAACGAPGDGGGEAEPAGGGIPRTPEGHPDLNGVWQAFTTASWNILDHNAQKGVPAGQGIVEGNEIPYQPWAAEQRQANYENRMELDPLHNCYLPGVPRIMYMPYPFRINQTPELTAITFEYSHAYRWIWTDGSDHPEALEFWMADSRGRWEGDTLVVSVADFNNRTWFDRAGNFHSEQLRLEERFTALGPNPHQLRGDCRGPRGVHAAVEHADRAVPPDGGERTDPRLRMPRVRGTVPPLGRAAGAGSAQPAGTVAARIGAWMRVQS